MFKKLNKKGFTLAELLIVVAIIGVLVAVSIPIFTAQLKKARLATNQANARAAYAAAVAKELDATDADATHTYTYNVSTAKLTNGGTAGSFTTPIADWDVNTSINRVVMGDTQAATWIITIDETNGTKFNCTAKASTSAAGGESGEGH